MYTSQGITVDPQEDNLFDWKCTIKGAVRPSSVPEFTKFMLMNEWVTPLLL